MKAEAAVFPQANVVEFSQVSCDDPCPDDVVVRLAHSWISNGTESSFLRGQRIAGNTARRENDPHPFPIVPGYQKVGIVEWVGNKINDLKKGEVVFAARGRVQNMFQPYSEHISPMVCKRNQVWKLPCDANPLAICRAGFNPGRLQLW